MPLTEEQARAKLRAPKVGDTIQMTPPTMGDISKTLRAQSVREGRVEIPDQPSALQAGALSGPERLAAPVIEGVAAVGARQAAAGGDESALETLGRREGVPFDIESGAGFMARLAQGAAFNREEKRALLMRNPNVTNVRFNSLGEPVLTIKDPDTGDVKDVLANPVGFDASDFAFIAANAPEMVAGGIAAMGRKASTESVKGIQALGRWLLSSKKVVPSAARAAGAGQMAGAIQDILSRPALGLPTEMGEIGKQRAIGGLADLVFGLGMGGGGKVASRVISPFDRQPIRVNAEAAQELWKRAGVDLDFTPAELTQNPFMLRSEAFMTQKPGSSAPFDKLLADRREALGKAQGILLGTDPSLVPHAEVAGRMAMEGVESKLAPLDWAISRETKAVLDAASADISKSLRATTGVAGPVKQSAVGARLFESANARLEAFRAQDRELYNAVYDNPLVSGRNIDATPLSKDAKSILSEVAAVEKQVEKPTGIVGPEGTPITKEVSETKPFSSFVDSGAMNKLRQLSESEGGTVSLRDLIELRRDIDDDLFRGGALGGLPERRLQTIRDAITKRIKGGLQELDESGKLLKSWETANKHHAENIRRFKEVDIVEMFRGPQQNGVLGLNEVVERGLRDPDRWQSYRDFFGETSREMNFMRRIFADRIVGRTGDSQSVDAAGFLRRLDSAMEKSPDIVDDVFGGEISRLKGFAKAAEQAGRKEVNVDELADLIDQKSLTREKLQNLMDAQANRSKEYENEIFRTIGKGLTGPDAIRPNEFVDKIIFGNTEPGNISSLVSKLSDQPETLDAIRQRTLLKIFNDAQGGPLGKETLTATGLEPFLKDVTARRLEPILGAETMTRLRALSDYLKPGESKEKTFRFAGQMSASSQVSQLEEAFTKPDTMWSAVSKIGRSFLLASAYKTGPVRNFISNNAIGGGDIGREIEKAVPFGLGAGVGKSVLGGRTIDRDAFVNAFVVASPIVEEMMNVFGSEGGKIAALEFKQAIDGNVRNERPKSGLTEDQARQMLRPNPTP